MINSDSESPTDKILIIDNIDNPNQFSSSKCILREINLYCSNIKIEFVQQFSSFSSKD